MRTGEEVSPPGNPTGQLWEEEYQKSQQECTGKKAQQIFIHGTKRRVETLSEQVEERIVVVVVLVVGGGGVVVYSEERFSGRWYEVSYSTFYPTLSPITLLLY
eukprot:gene8440-5918_t